MGKAIKSFGIGLLATLAILAGRAAPVRAQFVNGRFVPGTMAVRPPINPGWVVAPGLNLQQAAYNMAVTGRALRHVAPYIYGYNPNLVPSPFYGGTSGGYNPLAASHYNPYANPYLGAGNLYASLYSTGGGYAGTSALTSVGGLPTTAGGYTGGSYTGSSYYPPYYPPYGYSDPWSGYLRGGADIINAQGKLQIQFQQAKMYKEQAEQAKIDTRRKLFDEIMYERAHTPSFTEIQEKIAARQLRRSQSTASITEVWSARALNILLKDLIKLRRVAPEQPMDLDPDILKQINVRGGSKSGGNIGVLRNGGQLTWPLGLKDLEPAEDAKEIRSRLEKKAISAVRQGSNGAVDTGVLKDLANDVRKLHKLLAKNVNELPTNQYIEAKRYLNNLDEAMVALGSPDVANYFNQTWVAKGKTVRGLVDYMAEKGLTFAPATAGDEAAYQALYSALANYDVALHQTELVSRDRKENGKGKEEAKEKESAKDYKD
jgi:hypothetical protein